MAGSWSSSGGRCGLVLALLVMAVPALGAEQKTQAPAESAEQIEPQAERLLRQMSDFLAGQREFTVHTEGTLDVVLDAGQKIQINRTGDVRVRRPDRLQVDRTSDLAGLKLFYDGRQLTLSGERTKTYATTEAPPTLDATIDMAAERLGMDVPGADLLFSNPYATLIEDVRSGSYLGRAVVGGVPVHHLAFRNREGVDWEIWIEDGPQPLPRKYVVTSRDMPASPQYSVTLSDWNLSPQLTDEQFRFTPPRDAMRVSFREPGSQGGQQQGGQRQESGQQQGGAK